MKIPINDALPNYIKGPYGFKEPRGSIEGQVASIPEITKKFEPVDVLNGAIELIDVNSNTITLVTEDLTFLQSNEYPPDSSIFINISDFGVQVPVDS